MLAGACAVLQPMPFISGCRRREGQATTFIARVPDYRADIASAILLGMREIGITRQELAGKSILLKPNLVEVHPDAPHINTHPLVVRGAAEAFLKLGAKQVLVGEGPGHSRDSMRFVEEAGLLNVLSEDQIPFIDLNYDDIYTLTNRGRRSRLKELCFPATLRRVDWIVSMPKVKTHHWAGITVAMKNLFGVMPGRYYGWPKNVLHYAGIDEAIFDINATLQPSFAIADGIVGMEGDGPIKGRPKPLGAIVMGRNLAAVDATCARIMGINPRSVPYLSAASGRLGPIDEKNITQRGESIKSVFSKFVLEEAIPAQRQLMSHRYAP